MYIEYSELVHMAEMHSQARASSPYELFPNILRYTFNNLYILYGRVFLMAMLGLLHLGLDGLAPGITKKAL